MEHMEYQNDEEYINWLTTLSKNDINEILYDFFCCLDEQEEEIFTESLNVNEIKHQISQNFHKDSVLYDIDKDVAELSYEILKTHYPKAIDENVSITAKLRGFENDY
jgi:hypothetical protein